MLKTQWLSSALIILMPVLLIFFLGVQMAAGQVQGRFVAYQQLPQISNLAELEQLSAGQVVLLRGQISETSIRSQGNGLLIYQERPAAERENRYNEQFPLVFPAFMLKLRDGTVKVTPSASDEHVIQHELHTVAAGDRQYTGFKPGDIVTVQGIWQRPALVDASGITSVDKATLLAEWQRNVHIVSWLRNGLLTLCLLAIVSFVVQLRFHRKRNKADSDPWTTPQTKTTVTT